MEYADDKVYTTKKYQCPECLNEILVFSASRLTMPRSEILLRFLLHQATWCSAEVVVQCHLIVLCLVVFCLLESFGVFPFIFFFPRNVFPPFLSSYKSIYNLMDLLIEVKGACLHLKNSFQCICHVPVIEELSLCY